MKSASDRYGLSSPWSTCWRSIGNRTPLSSARSSPSARAGQNPYTARARSQPFVWISSSSSCACPNSSRAAAPWEGLSRIAGYLPLSSQAWKKKVQSTYSRSSEREQRPARARVLGAQLFLQREVVALERLAPAIVEQI